MVSDLSSTRSDFFLHSRFFSKTAQKFPNVDNKISCNNTKRIPVLSFCALITKLLVLKPFKMGEVAFLGYLKMPNASSIWLNTKQANDHDPAGADHPGGVPGRGPGRGRRPPQL